MAFFWKRRLLSTANDFWVVDTEWRSIAKTKDATPSFRRILPPRGQIYNVFFATRLLLNYSNYFTFCKSCWIIIIIVSVVWLQIVVESVSICRALWKQHKSQTKPAPRLDIWHHICEAFQESLCCCINCRSTNVVFVVVVNVCFLQLPTRKLCFKLSSRKADQVHQDAITTPLSSPLSFNISTTRRTEPGCSFWRLKLFGGPSLFLAKTLPLCNTLPWELLLHLLLKILLQ